jgi:uncharacterized ferritin-like protein (DUF455 family)
MTTALLTFYVEANPSEKCRALCASTDCPFDSKSHIAGMMLPAPGLPPLTFCDPKDLPKRKLDSREGKSAFYHALAHIEFTAVNLALDAVLRFPGLPAAFYQDWWQVAQEEAAHFLLLADYLHDLESYYGALPVHAGLWEMAERTQGDPLLRMALVPRVLEARGLDVTPSMIARLKAVGDGRGVAILEKIYQEEIGHVAIGSRWFQALCQDQGLDPEKHFVELIAEHLPRMKQGPFNHAGRHAAGFSDAELQGLLERNLAQA